MTKLKGLAVSVVGSVKSFSVDMVKMLFVDGAFDWKLAPGTKYKTIKELPGMLLWVACQFYLWITASCLAYGLFILITGTTSS